MSNYFNFDSFDQFEIPNLSLCNPDLSELYNLGNIRNRSLKLRFTSVSEFSFTADRVQDGVANPYYDYLDYRRIVNIDGIGYFSIVGKSEYNDGMYQYKEITCQSIDTELNFKKISLLRGTFPLATFIDGSSEIQGLVEYVLQYLPDWTFGSFDYSLYGKFRTFDISDATIYSLLVNNASNAYQCVFTFDYINKTINVSSVENATTESDIFLSYENLIKEITIKEVTEELVTALNVFGGGNLNIRRVNPLGTNTIYNFDYYKNLNWMSQSLIDQIDSWDALLASYAESYASTLTAIILVQEQILTMESDISFLYTEEVVGLDALLAVQAVRIQQGLPIDEINVQIEAKRAEIAQKQSQLDDLNTQKDILNESLDAINAVFAGAYQSDELSPFIIGSTYTNENITINDLSTPVDEQEAAQQLYDQALEILAKVSEPRYTIEINAINFVFLKDFQKFIDQLSLGVVVTIEYEEGKFVYPALLGIDVNYDNPSDCKLIFSNRLRLDDEAFQFSDLFNSSLNSGISTQFNSELWSSWTNYSRNDVTEFINSALDASKNAVISAQDQSIIIDANGLRARQATTSGSFLPEQIWMINNMIVFTKDNWNTASMAIGKISGSTLLPTSGSAYGIVADAIIGRLIAGNDLIIQNDNSSFIVSGSLATLSNAVFTVQNTVSRIVLNPDEGISISKKNPLGGFDRKFYIDSDGNVVFSGDLEAASGTFNGEINATSGNIGSWHIDDRGLYDDSGNYIYGNGDVKLGKLTINGSNATFDGVFYAQNLHPSTQFTGTQLRNLIGDTITSGTIRGINIFGSRIFWGNTAMYESETGVATIITNDALEVSVGTFGAMFINGQKTALLHKSELFLGYSTPTGKINMRTGALYMNGKQGVTGTFLL